MSHTSKSCPVVFALTAAWLLILTGVGEASFKLRLSDEVAAWLVTAEGNLVQVAISTARTTIQSEIVTRFRPITPLFVGNPGLWNRADGNELFKSDWNDSRTGASRFSVYNYWENQLRYEFRARLDELTCQCSPRTF